MAMYQTKIVSVNGRIAVNEEGKNLYRIGNMPVSPGDYVWTDGVALYGFYQDTRASKPYVYTSGGDYLLISNVHGSDSDIVFMDVNGKIDQIASFNWVDDPDGAQFNWVCSNEYGAYMKYNGIVYNLYTGDQIGVGWDPEDATITPDGELKRLNAWEWYDSKWGLAVRDSMDNVIAFTPWYEDSNEAVIVPDFAVINDTGVAYIGGASSFDGNRYTSTAEGQCLQYRLKLREGTSIYDGTAIYDPYDVYEGLASRAPHATSGSYPKGVVVDVAEGHDQRALYLCEDGNISTLTMGEADIVSRIARTLPETVKYYVVPVG